MKKYGIDDAGAATLLHRFGAAFCWPRVRAMPIWLQDAFDRGRPIKHPSRWLRAAIEQGYELPDALRAELVAVPPRIERVDDRETRRIVEEVDDSLIWAAIGELPTGKRAALERRADDEAQRNPLFGRAGILVRENLQRAALLRLAREQLVTSR